MVRPSCDATAYKKSQEYKADSGASLEWEAKPSSPESIRLISMGKMLNDKSRLAGKQARIYMKLTSGH